MSTDYDWDLSRQAVERLLQAKLSERRALIECFDRLALSLNQIKGERPLPKQVMPSTPLFSAHA